MAQGPAIDANAVYTKEQVAALLSIAPKTVERWAGISGSAAGGCLPKPFYLNRRPYWRGSALLRHLDRLQAKAIEV